MINFWLTTSEDKNDGRSTVQRITGAIMRRKIQIQFQSYSKIQQEKRSKRDWPTGSES